MKSTSPPGRRDDLATYLAGRENVHPIKPHISGRPEQAVVDLSDVYGADGTVRWLAEAMRHAGQPVAGLVIELAKVPAMAQELANAPGLSRRAELVTAIERAVVDIVSLLQGPAA